MSQPSSSGFSQITVAEFAQIKDGDSLQLVDVREPWELEMAQLDGFINLPLSQYPEWSETIHTRLLIDRETLVLCHHGVRSAQMCHWLVSQGFTNVKNISGGIAEYASRVDPTVPTY